MTPLKTTAWEATFGNVYLNRNRVKKKSVRLVK